MMELEEGLEISKEFLYDSFTVCVQGYTQKYGNIVCSGSGLNPWLCRDLNICKTFLTAKAHSNFQPYEY